MSRILAAMVISISMLGIVFVTSGSAVAAAAIAPPAANSACVEAYGHEGNIQYETQELRDGSCVLQLVPTNYVNGTYRIFLFDNRGCAMIFNVTPGPESTSIGARTYFFFPRKYMPGFQVSADGTLSVTSTSGVPFNFSEQTALLTSIPGTTFAQDPVVSMKNNGGVEITAAPGVWIDTGWQTGETSYHYPNRHSVVHAGTATCDVANSELFNYVQTSPLFKFPVDKDFATFLGTRCPDLDVSVLK